MQLRMINTVEPDSKGCSNNENKQRSTKHFKHGMQNVTQMFNTLKSFELAQHEA